MEKRIRYCQYCGEPIKNENTLFCEKCGKKLVEREVKEYVPEKSDDQIVYHKNKYLATILSLYPGLGQLHNGQILKGLVFIVISLILVNLQYSQLIGQSIQDTFSWLSFIFRVYNMYDAYKTASDINRDNGNYFYNENLKNRILANKNGIVEKLHQLDITISNYFHDMDYNGKKTVSVGKIILIFVVSLFMDDGITYLLHVPDITWDNFWYYAK
ncbi:zinc ribbon domain-containing protein [Methanobrevibacter curvatus]|uniref:Zinc-ribbon domain-containing protein n=1 Tax=Methanobrevibacter curvatus TaxID=49547 RepID=A0A165Z231_9EURY|nr:zinc ribbon domain-containing protein [Methanobrevibacter curvatus]KZX10151.1 hypothetical protein MBCUR_18860 [Methanobrevibacter curvatus]